MSKGKRQTLPRDVKRSIRLALKAQLVAIRHVRAAVDRSERGAVMEATRAHLSEGYERLRKDLLREIEIAEGDDGQRAAH